MIEGKVTKESVAELLKSLQNRTFVVRVAEEDEVTFVRVYEGEVRWMYPHTFSCIANQVLISEKLDANGELLDEKIKCDCEPVPTFALGSTILDSHMETSTLIALIMMSAKAQEAKAASSRWMKRLFGKDDNGKD